MPGIPHGLRLDDILPASAKLDNEFDPPPRGGMAMRTWRPGSVDAIAAAVDRHGGDPGLRREVGAHLRDWLRRFFSG